MNIFRLLYIFLKLRNSGIFNSFIDGFNPLIKTFYNKGDSSRKLRIVLEELGPVYIKLGQLLSTRTDIISKELALELNGLTDNCQAIEFHEIKEIIEFLKIHRFFDQIIFWVVFKGGNLLGSKNFFCLIM